MAQINMNPIGEVMPLERLCEEFSKWQRLLRNVINGDIDFENIRAQGIIADNIKAGTITANEIAADTITADKMNVNELSAIAADLGTITAGIIRGIQIFGSYIATREGAYPRAEMNDDDDFLAVYLTADIFTKIVKNLYGSPAFTMIDPVTISAIYNQSAIFPSFVIQTDQDIDITPGTGKRVYIPSWSQLYSNGDTQSLKTALDNLTSAINTLNTQMAAKATAGSSTGSAGGGNGGIPIGATWTTSAGVVSWAGISSHSHTQT